MGSATAIAAPAERLLTDARRAAELSGTASPAARGRRVSSLAASPDEAPALVGPVRRVDAPQGVLLAIQEVLREQLAALGVPPPPEGSLATPDVVLRRLLRAYHDATPAARAVIADGVARAAGTVRDGGGTASALVIDGTA
jgi:hypothetical protein